ncbi:MAG: MFS transporter [Chlamydiia bacterium]|nr:MFS transporter [Chlamydiia bacterium]
MDKEIVKQKTSLFSIFFTFAVDNLGATIVFPIFAPLFLDPSKKLISGDASLAFKTTMLGFFLGVFPLMQFIFAPIFGEYADHYGRKKALIATTFLTFLGYALSAIGIHQHSLFLVFFARLIMGIGAGNLSICLSSLSDLSPSPKKKVRYYSYGSAIAGLTFILGPFIGGKLSDPTVYPTFNSAFPMFIGAVLGLINVFFILFAFGETLENPSTKPFDFIKGLHNIQIALKTKSIKRLYVIYFFYLFSWNIVFLFVPAFLVENFHLSNSRIGDVCALLGVCWIFGTGILHRLFYHLIPPKVVLLTSFVIFSALVVFVPYPNFLKGFLLILGGCTIISGLIWPMCTSAISDAAPSHMQGKVLGLSQSMLSLTMMLSSILGGLFLHAHSLIPFVFSGLSSLIAAALLLRVKVE